MEIVNPNSRYFFVRSSPRKGEQQSSLPLNPNPSLEHTGWFIGGLGSVGFIAPEILKDQVHTPAMDIFGMGVVLFIMLVGRKPFDVKETENLTYANIGLEGAPGLKDSRLVAP